MPACPSCHHEIDPEALLAACTEYWPHLGAGQFTCPHCRTHSPVRIESGRLWLGYIYGAGTAHFSAEEEHAVPGLLVWPRGDNLEASLEGVRFRIPMRGPG
jgi:hypothetical protein